MMLRRALGAPAVGGLARTFVRALSSAGPPPPAVLSTEQCVAALRRSHPQYNDGMHSFYSSVLDGIVTDPALMVVPLDDRMVHRGHAVFDTANVHGGQMYGLDFHLDRLLRSASQARIDTSAWPKERLRQAVLHTAAASGQRDSVFVRYWMSSGRGLFGIAPDQQQPTTFFALCHHYAPKALSPMTAVQVDVPIKPQLLANIKSNNYLLNALVAMEAADRRGQLGIQTDDQGFVTESAVGCVAIVDADGVLRTPPFQKILRSTTLVRALELAPELVQAGAISGFEQCDLRPEDLSNAAELFCIGGGGLEPIVAYNGEPVGTGEMGPATEALAGLLLRDLKDSEHLDEIPYAVYGH